MPATPFNSGLPPQGVSSAQSPIGSQALLAPAGTFVDLADGSRWLQSGSLASAQTFPQAALLDHLACHGATAYATLPEASGDLARWASDGNGTVLYLAQSNLYRSTDWGVTWSTFISALGIQACDLIWAGNRFIIVGNSGGTLQAAHSATGAAGSWTTGTSVALTSAVANSARLAASASTNTAVIVLQGNAGQAIWRAPTGSTFSAYAASASQSAAAIAWGGGMFHILSTPGGSNSAYSTDDGVNWTYYTPAGGQSVNFLVYCRGAWFCSANNNSQWYASTNPTAAANWTLSTTLPPAFNSASGLALPFGLSTDGTRLFTSQASPSGAIFVSDDLGTSWRRRSTTLAPPTNPWRVVPLSPGGPIILAPLHTASSTSYMRTRGLSQPEFVGVPYASFSAASYSGAPVLYSRVK